MLRSVIFYIFIIAKCYYIDAYIEVCEYRELPEAGARYLNESDLAINNMAVIILWNEGFEGGFKFCSSMILNESFVITSAHCLSNPICKRNKQTRQMECNDLPASKYDVVTGTLYIIGDKNPTIKRGKNIFIHPDFDYFENFSFDVGLLEIEGKFNLTNKIIRNIGTKVSNQTYDVFVNVSTARIRRRQKDFAYYIVTYGDSPCSSVYTKRVRHLLYTSETEKFMRLRRIDVIDPDRKTCHELFGLYQSAQVKVKDTSLICINTNFANENCEDLSGSPLLSTGKNRNQLILGVFLQPIVCNYNQHYMVIRLSTVTEFVHGIKLNHDAAK